MLDQSKAFRLSPLSSIRSRAIIIAPLTALFVVVVACGGDETNASPAAPSAACGNGVLEANEECEGFDLRGATCDALGLSIGQIRCGTDCKLDTTACGGVCGDGNIGPAEACDGANLNGATCASLFGAGSEGTLGCTSDCRSLLTDTCRGGAPQAALTACVVGASPSTCPAPTSCVATASGAFCLEPCDAAAATNTTCGAGRYCEDVGGTGACASMPGVGAGCTAKSGCREAGNSCIPTFESATGATISTCAPSCVATQVGKGQGSCAVGSSCTTVANGPQEIEKPTAACTAATEATDCTTAQGYRCKSVKIAGAAADAMRCARPYGQCAPVTPLYKFDGSTVVDSLLCDRVQPTRGAAKCGLVSPTPLVNPARVECVEHFTGVSEVGVCVAFCDGTVLGGAVAGAGGGPDGSCGDGATCKAPTEAEYFVPQADTAVVCTDLNHTTVCGAQFDRCLDLGRGQECARAVRICVPN